MNDYRHDIRTPEQFAYSIKRFSLEEKRYLRLFLDVHNVRRKKRDLTVIKWGNKNGGVIVDNIDDCKTFCRPDYLLCRCEDNSYFIKTMQPVEVQTCSSLHPDVCYIKKSKVDWNFDDITKKVCNRGCHILYIIGSKSNGKEKYKLISDFEINRIKTNGIRYPDFMGGKPCYFFSYPDFKWKSFNKDVFQKSLEVQ